MPVFMSINRCAGRLSISSLIGNSSAPYVEVGAFYDVFAASRLYQRRSSLAISVSSDSLDKELKRVAFLQPTCSRNG